MVENLDTMPPGDVVLLAWVFAQYNFKEAAFLNQVSRKIVQNVGELGERHVAMAGVAFS